MHSIAVNNMKTKTWLDRNWPWVALALAIGTAYNIHRILKMGGFYAN